MRSLSSDAPSISPATWCHWPAAPPPVRIPLTVLSGHDCPYLPGQTATDRAFLADELPPQLYHGLMDRGFRRSGKIVYQPVCSGCRSCIPVRVRVDDFVPSKSLRRCLRRNADLTVSESPLTPTQEKFDLYRRYQLKRHKDAGGLDWHSFVDFLYDSPVNTREFCYRDPDGRLLAVGIGDVCESSFSSVYFFYDPDQSRRGLGTFGVLREIEHCRAAGIPYYYLGFWVDGCRALSYKTDFRPAETLGPDGVWRDYLPPVTQD